MKGKRSQRKSRILFLLPFSLGKAPSQRFRAEAYFSLLKAHGHTIGSRSFYGPGAWEILYGSGHTAGKAWLVMKGFMKRFWQLLFVVPHYDFVFVQREASPVGPPIIEWAVVKIWRKRLIFDFDDATWIPNNSSDNKIISWLKAFWKIEYLCRWSYKTAAGNEYLAEYAKNYAKNVVVIPTVIDTDNMYQPVAGTCDGTVTVGWTGSHSTLKYLQLIAPALKKMQAVHPFHFLVIADRKPELDLPRWSFLPWQAATEIADLQKMDIGVMPLSHDPWSEGKCGFKLIQYLGLGIPAVASPVGVNKQIIRTGENGYLATSGEEWEEGLRQLLSNPERRRAMGAAGRKKIVAEYSLASQTQAFVSLFS